MKNSNEWMKQGVVDKAANRKLREVGGNLDRINANQIAKDLGADRSNESVNKKFNDWKERQIEAGRLHMQYAPPGLKDTVEAKLGEAIEDIVDAVLGLSGKAIAAQREDGAKTEELYRNRNTMLETEKADLEDRIEEANRRIQALEQQVNDLQGENTKLQSRTELAEARLGEARELNGKLIARISTPTNGGDVMQAQAKPTSTQGQASLGTGAAPAPVSASAPRPTPTPTPTPQGS